MTGGATANAFQELASVGSERLLELGAPHRTPFRIGLCKALRSAMDPITLPGPFADDAGHTNGRKIRRFGCVKTVFSKEE